ncbi:MAG: hypothetical protein AAF411_24425 [Myxococcota bacterium]
MGRWSILLVFAALSTRAHAQETAAPEAVEASADEADEASNVERAEALFRQAAVARRELRMAEAREMLTESLALDPHAPTAYNLALVLVEVGAFVEAVERTTELLEGRYGALGETQADAVRELRDEARVQTAALEVRATVSIPLDVLVDGEPIGTLEAGGVRVHDVDPGSHAVLVLSERGRINRRVNASSGETVGVIIRDEDFPSADPAAPAPDVRESSRRSYRWLWIALGVVAVGAGVTAGVLATRSDGGESTLPLRFVLSNGR